MRSEKDQGFAMLNVSPNFTSNLHVHVKFLPHLNSSTSFQYQNLYITYQILICYYLNDWNITNNIKIMENLLQYHYIRLAPICILNWGFSYF
jgi:hypothetical protein